MVIIVLKEYFVMVIDKFRKIPYSLNKYLYQNSRRSDISLIWQEIKASAGTVVILGTRRRLSGLKKITQDELRKGFTGHLERVILMKTFLRVETQYGDTIIISEQEWNIIIKPLGKIINGKAISTRTSYKCNPQCIFCLQAFTLRQKPGCTIP